MNQTTNNGLPNAAADDFSDLPPDTVRHPYVEGGKAYLGGQDITAAMKDCSKCPKCGLYGRKSLVGEKDCFRCNPKPQGKAALRAMASEDERLQASRTAAAILALVALCGVLAGAVITLLIR